MTEPLDRTSFTYSIVIPVFNSVPIVGDTIDRVVETFTGAGLRYELILVNDGSSDRSWQVISERAARLPHVVALNLMRNYGQHYANLAGLTEASLPKRASPTRWLSCRGTRRSRASPAGTPTSRSSARGAACSGMPARAPSSG
jgi:cellulose synthase/poly-beta-1,6-N-acetylglucosamine synthase-like glycosyltransferase